MLKFKILGNHGRIPKNYSHTVPGTPLTARTQVNRVRHKKGSLRIPGDISASAVGAT